MCECKGGYICPEHTVFKSSVVTQKPKTQKRKGITVRQAIEVMGRNKIGRRFARNNETSVAARILMGAYKNKSGKAGCPDLQQVINYLSGSSVDSSVIRGFKLLADRIARHSVTIERQTLSKNSSIIRFSVSKYDIVAAYRAAGIHFNEYSITLDDPLQEIGFYTIKIDLAHGIKTEAKVWVVPTAT